MKEKLIDLLGAVLCFALAVLFPLLASACIDIGGGQ